MKTQANMKGRIISFSLVTLASVSAAFSMSGCAQRAKAQALPAGNFRVTVKDLVSDPATQVKQIIIEKEGTGELQVNADIQHSGFKINTSFRPRQGQSTSVAELVFVADMVPSSKGSTILHLANQVTTSGSGGSLYSSYSGQISSTSKSATHLLSAIKPGLYPVGVPLELGPVCGKPITLTISEGKA